MDAYDTPELDRIIATPVRPTEAPFAVHGDATSAGGRRFIAGLRARMRAAGHPEQSEPTSDTRVVLHVTDHDAPISFRRRSAATFVVGIVEAPIRPADPLREAYPYLLRTLGNLGLYLVPGDPLPTPMFVTLEQGLYEVSAADEVAYFDAVYSHIAPLALSRLVIDNEFVSDLPAVLEGGDFLTRGLADAGRRLDELGLLPAPFELADFLSPRELRHVMKLYSIGGLSYGNLSVRKDATSFWMSASGVDKSDMTTIGRHILLVTGFDAEHRRMRLSVPQDRDRPGRVSVDAIEHWMIYRRHPEVGAIVHAHAWLDGAVTTQMNYPCGTVELASAVADLVADSPEPGRAIVGQKNHGLTITGPDLGEILDRIDGRIHPRVPMAA